MHRLKATIDINVQSEKELTDKEKEAVLHEIAEKFNEEITRKLNLPKEESVVSVELIK